MAQWEGLLKVAEDSLKSTMNCGRKEIEGHVAILRDEALARFERLREQARQEGLELLSIAARQGVELARDCGLALPGARRRRSRFGWGWAVAAVAVAAVAGVLFAASRD